MINSGIDSDSRTYPVTQAGSGLKSPAPRQFFRHINYKYISNDDDDDNKRILNEFFEFCWVKIMA